MNMEFSSNARREEKRDNYIDFVRGLCVISVILIHTVFWSGTSYTPLWMKNLVLLFDVPLFFFLAGATMSVTNKFDPLKQIAKIIVLFFVVVFVFNLFSGSISLNKLIGPIALSGAKVSHYRVVDGSYWFVPVYVVSIIYTAIIKRYTNNWFINSLLVLIPVYYIYSWYAKSSLDNYILGVPAQREFFYLWIMLLGVTCYKCKNKIIWTLVGLIGICSLFFFGNTIQGFYLQNYKFAVDLPYAMGSLLSISIVMLLPQKLNNKYIEYLGANAIYFYLSQGFGASMLYSITKHIDIFWPIKLGLCFAINLLISVLLGLTFIYISNNYKMFLEKVLKSLNFIKM